MMPGSRFFPAAFMAAFTAFPASAQSAPTDYRDEFLRQFEASSRKVVMLADAIPEALYTWSPGEGVMSIARVYMHIARYNYGYPATALDVPAPAGLDLDTMEDITDKATVTRMLGESVDRYGDWPWLSRPGSFEPPATTRRDQR
jgi:hypothetical protein